MSQVAQGDVDEALRLMNMSKISLEDEDVQEAVQHDPVRDAFAKVRLKPFRSLFVWPPTMAMSHAMSSMADPFAIKAGVCAL
jgi:hypothetical protein